MFWFLLIALVAVVAAVALAVLGDGGVLRDVEPDRVDDRLPPERPVGRADVERLRLPVTVRGYRMVDVDDVLERLGAELAQRDAHIADLEAALAGAHATRLGGHSLVKNAEQAPRAPEDPRAPGSGQ
ncbi:cell division protein DivIVA [Streptomyces sp. NPDC026673]|uniref:cell division protein DivIVA n=1 Tax=Streptomyces sp. NPDC026673 TaxID=3155724 RepID=UPI0033C32A04